MAKLLGSSSDRQDAHDHRRPRPKALLAGCTLISIYLARERQAEGEPDLAFRKQLDLCVAGWQFIDQILARAMRNNLG